MEFYVFHDDVDRFEVRFREGIEVKSCFGVYSDLHAAIDIKNALNAILRKYALTDIVAMKDSINWLVDAIEHAKVNEYEVS